MFDQWHDMLHMTLPVSEFIIRAVVVYVAVLVLLRISGKREMGQMGATEFVAILLISNAVQNSMNGGDNSVTGGLILAVALIATSSLITYLTYKSKIARSLFEGTPTMLVHRGKILKANLRRERLNESDLKILLRKQGFHSLTEIETAILEADGQLSVFREAELKAEQIPASEE